MKVSIKIIFIFAVICFFSCKKDNTKSELDLSQITFNSPIIRLDSEIFACKSKEELQVFLQKNKKICAEYFEIPISELPKFAEKLYGFTSNPALINFYKNTTNSSYGIKIDSLQAAINQAFKAIKYYYPNLKTPKIYTIFTGFSGKDLLVNDSTIVIGLDYFAGKSAQYRPQVYDYQLYKYEKEYIVPSVLNLFATRFGGIDPADKSLLGDMLFYGKCYEFTKTMIPNAADSLIIGYSQKQLDETEISQELVWGHVIDQKLLFEASPFKKLKYLDERPNVPEISPDCPGMIGRWLGWKIIKKFVENNNEVKFVDLMQNKNAQQIFEKSKYKGKADLE
jgi:hypothetical protein